MGIYTKKGDQGYTSLMNQTRVSKTDERIELLGTIDELSSHIGLARVLAEPTVKEELSGIQRTLITVMAGIADCNKGEYRLNESAAAELEKRIDAMENAFPRKKEFVLYGGCEVSARVDVARAVCRRAERQFYRVAKFHSVDRGALQYMNRLADYLYILARYTDYQASLR